MFQQGQQIGTYTLLHKLGRGGFGEVWLAEKRSQFVTKKVAVKLPLDEQINFDAIRQEAELWEQASGNANVLPIIDADVIDGQVVIVSEYADGGSLHDRLKLQGKLPIKQAVEMTIGILSGLDFLHNKRILHRDIKPQNILLQGNTPRLADFGISRAMQTTNISSKLVGTDAYMSPEAFDGKRSVQTDIWSVGVVLYQLLAGKLPFPQEHPSERIFAILTKEFPPLPNEIPTSLRQIVAKALAKSPENRYQTANQMREALQRALLEIEHPTMAKTEVLHIPISNQTVTDVTNIGQLFPTQEPKKETLDDYQRLSPEAKRIIEEAFNPEEPKKEPVATQFKQIPLTEQKPLPTEANRFVNRTQTGNGGLDFIRYAVAIGAGFIALLFVIVGATYFLNPRNTTQLKNASNVNSTAPINVEITTFGKIALTMYFDGKLETDIDASPHTSNYNAQSNFTLVYSIYHVDNFQLKINGKVIKLSKTPPLGSYESRFEVTKDNLQKILQKGSNEN
ncbi:MAG TPA: serine/threonine-protein kinase [Pyrinomonadaceae bacterium]|nr:serine/threonine-protein kinase [Pyrinomonadaceae bacterium]